MPHLITVSSRQEDILFGANVARQGGFTHQTAPKAAELKEALKKDKSAVVFWDADHKDALAGTDPTSIQSTGQVLREFSSPEKVFMVTEKPVNQTPYMFNMPVFGHHLYRNFNDPAPLLISNVAKGIVDPNPFGLAKYLPPGTNVSQIKLTRSGQRLKAIEAFHNVLDKKEIPQQLTALIAQSVDELLMNAIFDAPMKGGEAYRRKTERNQDFELSEQEMPILELGLGEKYHAASVTDSFGSLKKDSVLSFIRKDYETTEYKVREGDPGAGLGVYGILQSGLSLLFISKPNLKTQVVVFFPAVKSIKIFRTSFRFFSFI